MSQWDYRERGIIPNVLRIDALFLCPQLEISPEEVLTTQISKSLFH